MLPYLKLLKKDQNTMVGNADCLESLILKAQSNDNVRLGAVTTDNAPQIGRARRILAFRFPSLIFLLCWAHQMVCAI